MDGSSWHGLALALPSQRPWWGAHRPGPEDRQTWTRLQSSSVCNLPLGSLLGPPCCPASAPRVGGLPRRAVLWLHTTHHREEITPKPLSSASGTSSLSCGKTSVAEDCLRKSVTFQLPPFPPQGQGQLREALACSWLLLGNVGRPAVASSLRAPCNHRC